MIKLEHVSKAYSAGIPALNDVNLEIDDGEFVFVCGDSGSGKSTLIKLLLKELDPTDGTITVDGRNLAHIRRRQIPKYRRNIGVVSRTGRMVNRYSILIMKAKANAAQAIPEMLEIATSKTYEDNKKNKHSRQAKNGWYRYDTRLCANANPKVR